MKRLIIAAVLLALLLPNLTSCTLIALTALSSVVRKEESVTNEKTEATLDNSAEDEANKNPSTDGDNLITERPEEIPQEKPEETPEETPDETPDDIIIGEDDYKVYNVLEVNKRLMYSGNLIQIDAYNEYRFDRELLISRAEMAKLTSSQLLETYGFVNVYGKSNGCYYVKSADGYFLEHYALQAFNRMMKAYVNESGNTDVQIRNAYYYEEGKVCLNATGKVLDLEINKGKGTYPLNYATYKADYYDWFIENCARFGFIHVEDQSNFSTFRYVSEAHARCMSAYGFDLESYLEEIRAFSANDPWVYADDDGVWWIYYVPAASETTEIPLIGTVYSISGNNTDGFVVVINATNL